MSVKRGDYCNDIKFKFHYFSQVISALTNQADALHIRKMACVLRMRIICCIGVL